MKKESGFTSYNPCCPINVQGKQNKFRRGIYHRVLGHHHGLYQPGVPGLRLLAGREAALVTAITKRPPGVCRAAKEREKGED